MTTLRHNLVGAAVGNFFEWLDFTLYGYFALAIARNFFPAGNEVLSTLAAVTAFAAGFVVRPFGAWCIGRYADRRGRKAAMVATVLLMGAGTLLIAIAPPYQTAGFLGTAMVVIGRLLSGFAASGESGAAGALVIEACPPHRRGWYGAVFSASTYLALAAGSGLALLVFGTLGVERTLDWGWRIGFVVGLCVIPVGAYLRRHMNESLHPGAMQASGTEARTLPARTLAAQIIMVSALTGFGSAVVYLAIVFMPAFATQALKIGQTTGAIGSTLAALAIIAGSLIGGPWSDRRGRSGIMLFGIVLALGIGTPLYEHLLASPTPGALFAFQGACAFGFGLFLGGSFPFFAERFPPGQRALGIGLGYNIGVMLFGAASPVVSTYALSQGIVRAPLYYLLAAAVVSVVAILCMRKPPVWQRPLIA